MHVSWSQHTIHCEQANSYLTGTKSMRYKRMYPGKLEMDKILFCWDKIPFLSFLLTTACFTEVLVFTTECLSWWESSVKWQTEKIILAHVCLYHNYLPVTLMFSEACYKSWLQGISHPLTVIYLPLLWQFSKTHLRQCVIDVFCSTSTERSRNDSSLLLT